jgi:hypothetical protein
MSRNMEASYEEVCRALSETPVPDLEEVSAINFPTFTDYTVKLQRWASKLLKVRKSQIRKFLVSFCHRKSSISYVFRSAHRKYRKFF